MTDLLSGQLLHMLLIAVVDAALLSWLTLVWYRRSIHLLMGAPSPNAAPSATPVAPAVRSASGPAVPAEPGGTLRLDRHAESPTRPSLEFAMFDDGLDAGGAGGDSPVPPRAFVRLLLAYGLGAGLWAGVITVAQFWREAGDLVAVAWLSGWLANTWLLVPSLVLFIAVDRRSSLLIVVGYVAAIAFAVAAFTLVGQVFRGSFNTAPVTNVYWTLASLAVSISLPGVLLLPTSLRRVRALMPLALAAVLLFGVSSLLFREAVLVALDWEASRTALLSASSFGSVAWVYYGVFMIVALPVGWVAWRLIRLLAVSFERKRFSDGQLVVDCWWVVLSVSEAASLASSQGVWSVPIAAGAFAAYRAGVAVAFRATRPRSEPSDAAAGQRLTLLRVFGYQARTESLFDRVGQAWRYRGPVQLIAGTDLAMRTTDPADILAFLRGDLAQRYVRSSGDIVDRIAQLDDRRDPDGRFRINELYCHADTWKPSLQALLDVSQLVLADFRTFSYRNAGCRFELEQLLGRVPSDCVVIVYDHSTDVRLLGGILQEAWTTVGSEKRALGSGRVALVRIERQSRRTLSQLVACLRRAGTPSRVVTVEGLPAH